jgi:hypothetical protein
MAGDWIKMRKSLLGDPRVVRIMSALRADRFRTIGGLFSAWCLLDEQTEDGILQGYTAEVFDEVVGLNGLAKAMQSVGWLVISPQGVAAPNFTEHNGKSAKRRDQENVRKMSARHADKLQTESALEKRREEKSDRREEKRTEETNTEIHPDKPDSSLSAKRTRRPSVAIERPEDIAEAHWRDWTACRRKPVTESVLVRIRREAAKAGISADEAIRTAAERQWEGFQAEWLASDRAATERKPSQPKTFTQIREENARDVFRRFEESGQFEKIFNAVNGIDAESPGGANGGDATGLLPSPS